MGYISFFRRFCSIRLHIRPISLILQYSSPVRYLCVDTGIINDISTNFNAKNSFAKIPKETAYLKNFGGRNVNLLEQEYRYGCCLIKNKNFDDIPIPVIYALPQLSLLIGEEKNFANEIVSDWYLAFEKRIIPDKILPSLLYDMFFSLVQINKETNGDLLKKLHFSKMLKIIEITLEKVLYDERIFDKTIGMVMLLIRSPVDDEQFVYELKEKMLTAFESFVALAMSPHYHAPVVNRLGPVMFKLSTIGVSKPSDICLRHCSRLIIKKLYISTCSPSKISASTVQELKHFTQMLDAFAMWNFNPEAYYVGFWRIMFASLCIYHNSFTELICFRVSQYSKKFNINFDMKSYDRSTEKNYSYWNLQILHVLSKGDKLFRSRNEAYDLFLTKNLLNNSRLLATEDSKQWTINYNSNSNISAFLMVPNALHDLQMDQYFVDKIASDWISLLKNRFDSNWFQHVVQQLQIVSRINRATNGALLKKLNDSEFFSFISDLLKEKPSPKTYRNVSIIVKFLSNNLHALRSKSNGYINVESNLLNFWENCFLDFNNIDGPSFYQLVMIFVIFSTTTFSGIGKPSEACLIHMIKVFNDINFCVHENKNFMSLGVITHFFSALHGLNINPDLYLDGFSMNQLKTVSSLYAQLSASLSSDWMLTALKFDRVKEFMEFKPYWSNLLNEKLLPKSDIEKLIEEKKIWSNNKASE